MTLGEAPLNDWRIDLKDTAIRHQELFERFHGRSVLVTGASGLIGSYICDLLEQGNRQHKTNIAIYAAGRSLDRLRHRFAATETIKMVTDSSDGVLASADYVIHAGAGADPSIFAADPVGVFGSNIDGLRSILFDEVERQSGKRIVMLSSAEVYGQFTRSSAGSEPLPERRLGTIDILDPRAAYPSSKRAAETLCACFYRQYGVQVTIARPGYIFGPTARADDSRLIPYLLRSAIQNGRLTLNSPGVQLRSYCYVGDTAIALLQLALDGAPGEAYNIADPGAALSIREVAELIAQITGAPLVAPAPSKADSEDPPWCILDARKMASLSWRPATTFSAAMKLTESAMRVQTRQ